MEKKRNNWFSFTIFKESFKSNFISLFIVGIGNALIALVVILILSTLSLNTTKQSMLNMFNTANMEHTLKQSSAGAYIAFNGIIEAHENVMPQAENYLFTAYEGTSSAVDLLNEVSTSKITGEEEIFSHTDLYDFKANVEGAEKIYRRLFKPGAEPRTAGAFV